MPIGIMRIRVTPFADRPVRFVRFGFCRNHTGILLFDNLLPFGFTVHFSVKRIYKLKLLPARACIL
jgi:hypothetical protein